MVHIHSLLNTQGLGDLTDFTLTVDEDCIVFVFFGFKSGQADGIVDVTIGGTTLSSDITHSDGTTELVSYTGTFAAGEYPLSVTTNSGVLRYRIVAVCVEGVATAYVRENLYDAGTGVSASITHTVRESDNVLSVLTADTSVTATSADTLLATGTTGGGYVMRMAVSNDEAGTIDWTLGSSQAWQLTSIRFRGTTFRVGGPTHIVTPSHISTPDHIVVPNHVILNP